MSFIKKVSDWIRGRRSNAAKAPDAEQAVGLELGPYTESAIHEPITPTFPVPCLQPKVHKSSDTDTAPPPFATSESVKIKVIVGTGPAKQTWLIDKDLLCSFSKYFRGALRDDRFTVEAATGQCILPDDDPELFTRIVEWLHLKDCCKNDVSSDHLCRKNQKTGSRDLPEQTFVAADRFIMRLYCRLLLSRFIQDIESVTVERLNFIAQNPVNTVSIWRFTRHWVAYLMFMQNIDIKKLLQKRNSRPKKKLWKKPWSKQYVQIAGQRTLVKKLRLAEVGWASTDPRKYELDHWLQPCGTDIHANCEHRILRGVEDPEQREHWLVKPLALVIYLGPTVILVFASYVQSRDYLNLIPSSTKIISILTGLSMFGCVAHPIFGVIAPIIGMANAIMSTFYVNRCFPLAHAVATDFDICRVEAGLAGMLWLWSVCFLGIIFSA